MSAAELAVFVIALLSLAAWVYLILFHGRFWRADQRLPADTPSLEETPAVAVVVPARNEAEVIGESLASLFAQDYPAPVTVVLADDASGDGTAERAEETARSTGAADRFVLVRTAPLPVGWTGKLWAVNTGIAEAPPEAEYLLLTDADIVHAPETLRRLVAKAQGDHLDLVSLMVRLHCLGFAERLLIPAFVFFFQKLYPFPRVNDPGSRTAAAAGGCMLVRRSALARAGGIAAIRGALIDDCALARRIKAGGPVWLGLATESRSIRPYDGIGGIRRMVARTAYTQLRHNPLLLAGAVLGMALLYPAPPATLVWGLAVLNPWIATAGGLATLLMLAAYRPTYRLYGRPGRAFLLLPLAALLYVAMTVDSALRHARGAGGGWKGRTYPGKGTAKPTAKSP